MEAIETLASLWIAEHPEHHPDLSDAQAALARNYDETPEHTNPFLHLSMHLSISEQCSIDQPRGIRQAVELLARRLDSLHDAMLNLGLAKPNTKEWRAYLTQLNDDFPLDYEEQPEDKLAPQFVIKTLSEEVGPDAIYCAGVGQHRFNALHLGGLESALGFLEQLPAQNGIRARYLPREEQEAVAIVLGDGGQKRTISGDDFEQRRGRVNALVQGFCF